MSVLKIKMAQIFNPCPINKLKTFTFKNIVKVTKPPLSAANNIMNIIRTALLQRAVSTQPALSLPKGSAIIPA